MSYKLYHPHPSQPSLPTTHSKFAIITLLAPPSTDIWRKPQPHTDRFNAPLYVTSLPLKDLKAVQVTVKGRWKTLYDQGGLVMTLPAGKGGEGHRWVKTGIEHYNGKPHISAVACDRWADWSLLPFPVSSTDEVTIRMEREVNAKSGGKSSTLWIKYLDPSTGQWNPIREITWGFADEEVDCSVGVYAAKPTTDEGNEEGELKVEFRGLEVKRW
ncbi:MAG: hypothetical protein Q9166_007945 [cf. Caloplaca sp. 2 TL-2023]